jgi:hypothetical protein
MIKDRVQERHPALVPHHHLAVKSPGGATEVMTTNSRAAGLIANLPETGMADSILQPTMRTYSAGAQGRGSV